MKATCSSPEEIVELHNQTKEKWPERCWGDKDLAAKGGKSPIFIPEENDKEV